MPASETIPELQRQVLSLPLEAPAAASPMPAAQGDEPLAEVFAHGTVALLARASTALLKWGQSGFHKATEETRERRLSACMACPNLADPPKTMLYQGIRLLAGRDTKICTACGCTVSRKTALPTESCPRQNPDDPTVSPGVRRGPRRNRGERKPGRKQAIRGDGTGSRGGWSRRGTAERQSESTLLRALASRKAVRIDTIRAFASRKAVRIDTPQGTR